MKQIECSFLLYGWYPYKNGQLFTESVAEAIVKHGNANTRFTGIKYRIK